jgi:hypothetical protein
LTRLEILDIGFALPQNPPDPRRPPPQRRILLPVLTELSFVGFCEYMEEFVAQIDTPLLKNLFIMLFNQDTFNTPQLRQFISRSTEYTAPPGALFHIR